jgi:hypothetical protein
MAGESGQKAKKSTLIARFGGLFVLLRPVVAGERILHSNPQNNISGLILCRKLRPPFYPSRGTDAIVR